MVMVLGFSTDAANAFPDQVCKDNAPVQRESRWITCVIREDGAITSFGRFEESWSPRTTACVIEDIQSNKAEYRVDLGPDKPRRPKLVPVFLEPETPTFALSQMTESWTICQNYRAALHNDHVW